VGETGRDLASLESARQFFGAELRHWRTTRGLSLRQLADLTYHSHTQITRVERALRPPSADLARRADAVLHTEGALQKIWSRLEAAQASTGEGSETVASSLGLRWDSSTASTVGTVADLWRADLDRRAVIVGSAWAATAALDPARRWLSGGDDNDTSHRGGRRIGRSEVEVMWSMCRAFADADHHLGGGYARSTLIQFVNHTVSPMLAGTYDAETGRQLLTAAARLSDLGGFMCFDSARQGLGQRYYIQALRLASAAGDRALGAHILADMSLQAHDLGRPREALALAEAGHRTARDCGSPSTAARCSALQARAHALAGDRPATTTAMATAEHELNAAQPDDEPFWIRFFTPEQLAAEFMYAAHDLGQAVEVQAHAPTVMASSAAMQRREVLAASTLASSYLPGARSKSSQVDVERACQILTDALPSAAGLTSARGLTSINAVRRRLAPYRTMPAVQKVEQTFEEFATAGS
jgi:transcriptional regulator with XRE-family HTH domain